MDFQWRHIYMNLHAWALQKDAIFALTIRKHKFIIEVIADLMLTTQCSLLLASVLR